MALSNRNALSVAEIVLFTPAFLFTVFLCVRHGFGPNQGWLFLLLFVVIRLIGTSLELSTISNPTSIPLQTAAALLTSVGLSPLLFCTIGLLIRVCRSINKVRHTWIRDLYLRLLRIPIVLALVLVIIGSDESAGDLIHHGVYPIKPITKVGIIVLAVTFAIIVFTTGKFLLLRSDAEQSERRLLYAIAASLIPLLVRLINVFLTMFSHVRTFDVIYGSVVATACMGFMQEILVVMIYISIGISLPRFVYEATGKESMWSRFRARRRIRTMRFRKIFNLPALVQNADHTNIEFNEKVNSEKNQDGNLTGNC